MSISGKYLPSIVLVNNGMIEQRIPYQLFSLARVEEWLAQSL
jgi:hypothetical protein